jgi:hypothetical protein
VRGIPHSSRIDRVFHGVVFDSQTADDLAAIRRACDTAFTEIFRRVQLLQNLIDLARDGASLTDDSYNWIRLIRRRLEQSDPFSNESSEQIRGTLRRRTTDTGIDNLRTYFGKTLVWADRLNSKIKVALDRLGG